MTARRFYVSGRVQGVFFRASTRAEAARLRERAKAAQVAVEAAKKQITEIDREIDQLTRAQEEIKQKKAQLLGEVVFDIMNDPKIVMNIIQMAEGVNCTQTT